MRYLRSCLVLLLAISPSVFAATGSAIIPSWHSVNYGSGSNQSYFLLNISNITDKATSVSVRLFDKAGNIYQQGSGESLQVADAVSFDTSGTAETVKINIAANATISMSVLTSTVQNGYGVIEWQQDGSKSVEALVANGTQLVYKSDFSHRSERTISINNGMPF